MRSLIKNKLKKSHLFILCTYCVLLFFSCEDKDQINGARIEPPQDEYIDSNLNPGGENFGHVGDLYLNLASDEAALTYEFWKFDYNHLCVYIFYF